MHPLLPLLLLAGLGVQGIWDARGRWLGRVGLAATAVCAAAMVAPPGGRTSRTAPTRASSWSRPSRRTRSRTCATASRRRWRGRAPRAGSPRSWSTPPRARRSRGRGTSATCRRSTPDLSNSEPPADADARIVTERATARALGRRAGRASPGASSRSASGGCATGRDVAARVVALVHAARAVERDRRDARVAVRAPRRRLSGARAPRRAPRCPRPAGSRAPAARRPRPRGPRSPAGRSPARARRPRSRRRGTSSHTPVLLLAQRGPSRSSRPRTWRRWSAPRRAREVERRLDRRREAARELHAHLDGHGAAPGQGVEGRGQPMVRCSTRGMDAARELAQLGEDRRSARSRPAPGATTSARIGPVRAPLGELERERRGHEPLLRRRRGGRARAAGAPRPTPPRSGRATPRDPSRAPPRPRAGAPAPRCGAARSRRRSRRRATPVPSGSTARSPRSSTQRARRRGARAGTRGCRPRRPRRRARTRRSTSGRSSRMDDGPASGSGPTKPRSCRRRLGVAARSARSRRRCCIVRVLVERAAVDRAGDVLHERREQRRPRRAARRAF